MRRIKKLVAIATAVVLSVAGGITYANANPQPAPTSPVSSLHMVTPVRVLDTRGGNTPRGGETVNACAPLNPNNSTPTIGVGGFLPKTPTPNYTGLTLNVTVTNAIVGGYLSVVPWDQYATPWPPATSSLNFAPGQTIANAVISASSASGCAAIYVGAQGYNAVDVIVDITGYTTA